MFTGIVTDVGEVLAVTPRETGTRFRFGTNYDTDEIAIGASIACGGPCLTVVERGLSGNRGYFDVDASPETFDRTTIGGWRNGTRVNL
jgi:riboflavin synthase